MGLLMRDLIYNEIVISSHNACKLREFADLMAPFGIGAKPAKKYGSPEPYETGTTFEENAYIKALAVATSTGLPVMSDDSGLVVDEFDGAPCVYTANCAKKPDGTHDFAMAMQRTGEFAAVICLAWPDVHAEYFCGEAKGKLVWLPRGKKVFGYDTVFLPQGFDKTLGEMRAEEKYGWKPGQADALSHRTRVFQKFARAMFGSA